MKDNSTVNNSPMDNRFDFGAVSSADLEAVFGQVAQQTLPSIEIRSN